MIYILMVRRVNVVVVGSDVSEIRIVGYVTDEAEAIAWSKNSGSIFQQRWYDAADKYMSLPENVGSSVVQL